MVVPRRQLRVFERQGLELAPNLHLLNERSARSLPEAARERQENTDLMAHRRISSTSKGSPHVIPDTMKAAAVDRFGPPSALTLHEVPVPRPGPHEVLIAIDTAGIGSWDASIRDGSWRKPGRPRFPLVPGVDGAGNCRRQRRTSPARSTRRPRLRIRVRQPPGWLLRRVRRGTRRARGPCAEEARPTRCRSGCRHWVDRTPGHRRARTAAGTDRADLRCVGCRRHDGGSIRRSTRGARHRDRIRRRGGPSGPKARRSSRDRRAACGIHRSTQEVRARRTGWCACARRRRRARAVSRLHAAQGTRRATRTASNPFPWSGARSACVPSTRSRIRVNSTS